MLPNGFSARSNEVLLKYMVYGDESLTFETKKKLLKAAHKFIQAAKRF